MSDERPELHCPIAGSCGGCALIDLPYAEQLRRKRDRVREALSVFPGLSGTSVDPCRPAARHSGYRNRAKLAVREQEGGVAAGLYRRGSDRIVDLAPCLVQRPRLTERAAAVARWLGCHGLARPSGPVKYVDLRDAADDRWHLTLVVAADAAPARDWPVASLHDAAPGLVGLSINANPHDSSFVFGPTTRTVDGARSFRAALGGPDGAVRELEVPATGFFQVATEPLAFVHGTMREHLGPDGTLLDLYCGVGLHGLTLAALDAGADDELVGVEEHPAAAACARRNADRWRVRARFHTGAVERFAGELPAAPRVVLNPGRAGCRPAVLDALQPGPGRRAAYLSCDAITLARDLERLVYRGWRLRRVIPIDLLPQTDHVETLVLLAGDGL